MKHIDEIYKDWCGESHLTNSCHPVHDSAEAMDFAEYYYKEIMIEFTESMSEVTKALKELMIRTKIKQNEARMDRRRRRQY